jgi:hypothetical protein
VVIVSLRYRRALLVLSLTACYYAVRADLEPPPPSRFPDRELVYSYQSSVDGARTAVGRYLTQHVLPYRTVLSTPFTYVITVWVEERAPSASRRVRRAAFSVRLAEASQPGCVAASLNWLVESRGVSEEVWSTEAPDAPIRPSFADSLIAFLSANPCSTQ